MGNSNWEVRSTDSAGQGLFASKLPPLFEELFLNPCERKEKLIAQARTWRQTKGSFLSLQSSQFPPPLQTSISHGWDSNTHSPPQKIIAMKANSKDHFTGRDSKVRHLETVVQELQPVSRQKFFQLHDCKRKKGKTIKLVTTPSLHLLPDCEKSCEGIFRTNNFCLGDLGTAKHHGVFSTLSR